MINLKKKDQSLIDNLDELADKIDAMRLRTCYRYGKCDACPAHFGDAYGCAFAKMITIAEDIVDNCEN